MRADHHPSASVDAATVMVERRRLDALLDRVERLEHQVAALTAGSPAPPPVPTSAGPPGDGAAPPACPAPGPAIGRRRALAGLAGAAGAGAAAVLASGSPAAAANGDAVIIGSNGNIGSAPTGLAVTGGLHSYGMGLTDNGLSSYVGSSAVLGHARGQAFVSGVHGFAEGSSTGVLATSESGTGLHASATSGSAIFALSAGAANATVHLQNADTAGIGIRIFATSQLLLQPGGTSPPSSTVPATAGQLRWAVDGLWACVADGSPARWRKVVGSDSAGAFHLLPVPKRVYDSRPGTQPAQGPKTALPAGYVARTIDCKHNGSGVPAGATGVLLTILLVGAATANGNMTVWANDKPKPQSNTMVWGGSATRFTTSAVSAVDGQARVKIDASHTTHVVLDVVGYYR